MNVFWICGYDKTEIEIEVKEFRGKQETSIKQEAGYKKGEQRNVMEYEVTK